MRLITCFLMIACFLAAAQLSQAQKRDTLKTNRELQKRVDSLCKALETLKQDLEQTQPSENGEEEYVMQLLLAEDDTLSPQDRYSRRQRLNALLKAIESQPGYLQFNGGTTGTFQAFRQKENYTLAGSGSIDLFAYSSLGENGLILVDIEAISGDALGDYIQSASGLNADAGSYQASDGIDRLNILEVWMEYAFLDNTVSVTAGKIDLTNYFDVNGVANDETSQFMSDAFVNNASLPVYTNAPGMRVHANLSNTGHISYGLSKVENSMDSLMHGLMHIAEAGLRFAGGTAWEGEVNATLYKRPEAGGTGMGLSYTQQAGNYLRIFGRIGYNTKSLAAFHGITESYSGGIEFSTNAGSRDITTGLAYGRHVSPDQQKEQLAEFYLRGMMNEWMYVSPFVQWVAPMYETGSKGIGGVRFNFNF